MRRIALVAALVAMVPAASAHAAFPGQNGRIAFQGRTGAVNITDIHTIRSDGTDVLRLTNDGAFNREPEWSPDGTKIAWTSRRDGNDEVYVMNADGSGQTNLTNNPAADLHPTWSPDGTQIAFASVRDGGNEIYRMNADGSQVTRVTNDAIYDADPAWSPNGAKFAFVRAEEDEFGDFIEYVWTMNVDGSGKQQITGAGGPGCAGMTFWHRVPDWSPGGDKVAFVDFSSNDGNFCLQIESIGLNGGGLTLIKRWDEGSFDSYENPAWSPDGARIAHTHSADIEISNPDGTGSVNIGRGGTTQAQDLDWQPIPVNAYPRPRGASPMYVSLVPAYPPCTAPDRQHGAPLSFSSCGAPNPISGTLTVGTPDANGRQANSVGFAVLTTKADNLATPADESTVKLQAQIGDVREKVGLADYAGELQARVTLRITDRDNTPSPGGPGAATVTSTPFSYTVPCAITAATNIGSTCAVQTTANAVLPGSIAGGRRAVWELGRFELYDGGPDGDADTAGDNALFETQGVFIP